MRIIPINLRLLHLPVLVQVFNLKVDRQLSLNISREVLFIWFCWYDIILLHVQELARLLQERGEPVLAIRISWISRLWVLVFEQRHFYIFIMRLTVEERVFILESCLKTMSCAHCRQSFFEKFRRQAPVKSAIAKMIKKRKNAKKGCKEHGETCRYVHWSEWTSFPTLTVNTG